MQRQRKIDGRQCKTPRQVLTGCGCSPAVCSAHGGRYDRLEEKPSAPSRRRDCHSDAPSSPFVKRFNRNGEGVSAKWQSRRRLSAPSYRALPEEDEEDEEDEEECWPR